MTVALDDHGTSARARAGSAEQWRASSQEEPEVVPVAVASHVEDGILRPAAKDVDEQHDPRGEPVPESPEEVYEFHMYASLAVSRPLLAGSCHLWCGLRPTGHRH